MKFFHVYNEDYYKGLEKNGLLNKDTAFKTQNVFSVPKERQFNNIAAIGGKLHNIIRENKFPYYVDRIAGGITYFRYEYDKNLIREYEELLGDWFLGFQLHESASNVRNSDWKAILGATGEKGPFDAKKLGELLVSDFAVTPDGERLQILSQGTACEYAKLAYAETYQEFYEEIRAMYKMRMAETENHILPCDSYFMMTKLQNELGMKSFMPEVGAQIPDMRQQVALARGIARLSGKTWGTYYECWIPSIDERGGIEYSMPCFNTDPINEWYLTQDLHHDDFTSFGENGGSSRLLQNRIYYYALMSGADYFSEEWGLNCSYYDMREFTLSPYGETKKAFINDALKLQGIKHHTPFAVVLPKEFGALEVEDVIKPDSYKYLGSSLSSDEEKSLRHIDAVRNLLFGNEKISGNEGHVIKNSRFGDVFDIIYEDAGTENMKRYEWLIDASPDSTFAKKSVGSGIRVLESRDLGKLEAELSEIIPEAMPVYVDGLCWLVSADCNGKRYLSIFNNDGNMRTIGQGDRIDPAADREVTVKFKSPSQIKVFREGNFSSVIRKKDENTYLIKVPATAFIIIEF